MTLTYDKAWAARQARHPKTKFLFFWGHRPPKSGKTDEACFSQWFPSPFRADRTRYATAEHWMMVHKARLFSDEPTAQAILATDDPRKAKALGREVAGFDRATWASARTAIVVDGNRRKFAAHRAMAAFLLKTKTAILVEASPVDPIWGIGLSADHPNASRPEKWPGENLLGFCLMQVRDDLTKEAAQ